MATGQAAPLLGVRAVTHLQPLKSPQISTPAWNQGLDLPWPHRIRLPQGRKPLYLNSYTSPSLRTTELNSEERLSVFQQDAWLRVNESACTVARFGCFFYMRQEINKDHFPERRGPLKLGFLGDLPGGATAPSSPRFQKTESWARQEQGELTPLGPGGRRWI